jgi:hypothetical protein
MIEVWINGAGVYAPGLANWTEAAPVLRGARPYVADAPAKLAPALLPADVRRRTTEHIKLAVEVGAQAVAAAGVEGASLHSVFASSESDGAITHNICEEVARATPEVSPTRFHNSVNNAPAGYWCMAVQSRQPSTSLAAFDASVAVGLLEAVAQVNTEHAGVLLVVHDTPLPEPLQSVRPMSAIFGAALVLAAQPGARCLAHLAVSIEPRLLEPSRLPDAGLEGLRTGNPAARILPLLAALARGEAAELRLPYVHSQALRIRLTPA